MEVPEHYFQDEKGHYWHNGLGGTCQLCGATGFWDDFQKWLHAQWHEKLRRAVDETGSLG